MNDETEPEVTGGAAEEVSCRELIELVGDYLEGTLLAAERSRVDGHLSECEWCERYISQTRAIVGALGRLDGEESSDPIAWDRALAAFRRATAERDR